MYDGTATLAFACDTDCSHRPTPANTPRGRRQQQQQHTQTHTDDLQIDVAVPRRRHLEVNATPKVAHILLQHRRDDQLGGLPQRPEHRPILQHVLVAPMRRRVRVRAARVIARAKMCGHYCM